MDDWELFELAFVACFLVAWGALRLANRRRIVDARIVRTVGSFAGIDVRLASSPGGRRYVALGYEIENADENRVREIEVLLTSANARRLADLLEVATTPGKTLLQARVAARRRSLPKKSPAPQASR